MITLHQFGIRLTAILDDLTEAAFAALAWIEEDDSIKLASGPHQAATRASRKTAPRRPARSRHQPQWTASTARWVM